jgi:hypothetical protein
MTNKSAFLTEDELVGKLHELGLTDVSKRRVATWRAKEIIPAFDVIGAGRGQSLGRESSGWSNGETILEQAAEAYGLLKTYRTLDDLYFPLWVLGYHVPLGRIREALSRPLEPTLEFIEAEGGTRGELEDEIGDQAFKFVQIVDRSQLLPCSVPQDAIETFTNLLLNSRYNLSDSPFEDGVRSLQEFDDEFQNKAEAFFRREFPNKTGAEVSSGTMDTIFANADFISRYLSIEKLKLAVDASTDEDLSAVHGYLQSLRQVLALLRPFFALIEEYSPPELRPCEVDRAMIFTAAKLCVWAGLSLRLNGHGPLIEACLTEVLKEMPRQLDDEIERELRAAGPEIAGFFEMCLEHVNRIEDPTETSDAQEEKATPKIVDSLGINGHENCVILEENRLVTGTNTGQEVRRHG